MHGLGNDFVLVDCLVNKDMQSLEDPALSSISKRVCRRKFGIGADQTLLLYPSRKADFGMRIFNADGGEVEMCGNGIRCLAKYVWDMGYSDKSVLDVETPAGIIKPEKKGDMVKVDMGIPAFEAEKIPVKLEGEIVDYSLRVKDTEFLITCLSMGNPHAVIFVDNVDNFPVTYYGPYIETHALFPNRTNVEFVEVINSGEIRMRVWERGAGETLACGTGAAASVAASAIKNLTGREVTVHLSGGDLFIDWAVNGHVFMTGPAVKVFEGGIDINSL